MYIPRDYKNDNIDEIKNFIQQNSFGILVVNAGEKITATHIPLELYKNEAGEDVLWGHISKANPQWKNFENTNEVLAIFSGPHTYISSSWYDHENVPTWNYVAAHVYGTIHIMNDEQVLNALKRLVNKYEKASEKPVDVERMTPGYVEKEMRGLVGFEIKITKIEAAYKLSQNRDKKNHDTIINELEKKGDPNSIAIANQMKARKK
jgi:transcriptional regulator